MNKITLSRYRKLYFDPKKCIPGEHHFVAVYLLNKFKRIPDYLNPDGTKGVCGDIVFENGDSKKSFSVEVKIGKTSFCFSKNETNSWFVDKTGPFPNYLIALTQNYLFIIEWKKFSNLFIRLKNPKRIILKSRNSVCISEEDMLIAFKNSSSSFEIDVAKEKDIKVCFDKLNKEIEKLYE